MNKYIVVFVTVSSSLEAKTISKALLEKKLAACVNTLPGIESQYRWKGNIEKAKEFLLIIKTKKGLFQYLAKEVKKLHSYTVPEIISISISAGSKDYLDWINKNTV